MFGTIDEDFNIALSRFIKDNAKLAQAYGFDELLIAPWDTFSIDKSDEDNFIIYGKKGKIVHILWGKQYVRE